MGCLVLKMGQIFSSLEGRSFMLPFLVQYCKKPLGNLDHKMSRDLLEGTVEHIKLIEVLSTTWLGSHVLGTGRLWTAHKDK